MTKPWLLKGARWPWGARFASSQKKAMEIAASAGRKKVEGKREYKNWQEQGIANEELARKRSCGKAHIVDNITLRMNRKLDIRFGAWANFITVQRVEDPEQAGLSYTFEWIRRRKYPAYARNILRVWWHPTNVPKLEGDIAKTKRWHFRKSKGRMVLELRYIPSDDETDIARFTHETNATKRVAIAIALGDRIEDRATKIQQDDFGQLYDLGTMRFVRVICPSTRKVYWLSCHPSVETAKEAVAASFRVPTTEYNPTIQT